MRSIMTLEEQEQLNNYLVTCMRHDDESHPGETLKDTKWRWATALQHMQHIKATKAEEITSTWIESDED